MGKVHSLHLEVKRTPLSEVRKLYKQVLLPLYFPQAQTPFR